MNQNGINKKKKLFFTIRLNLRYPCIIMLKFYL